MGDFIGKYSGKEIEDILDRSIAEYPMFIPDANCVNSFLDIALSYARNVDKLYYGSGETAITAPDMEAIKNEEGKYRINCSGLVGLAMRGVSFENSRYNGNNKNISNVSWSIFPEPIPMEVLEKDRTSAEMFRWFESNGYIIKIKDGLSNMRPGDIIFTNWNMVSGSQYKSVSHIAIFAYMDKDTGKYYMIESRGVSGVAGCYPYSLSDLEAKGDNDISRLVGVGRLPLFGFSKSPNIVSTNGLLPQVGSSNVAFCHLKSPLVGSRLYTVMFTSNGNPITDGNYVLYYHDVSSSKNIIFSTMSRREGSDIYKMVFCTPNDIPKDIMSISISNSGLSPIVLSDIVMYEGVFLDAKESPATEMSQIGYGYVSLSDTQEVIEYLDKLHDIAPYASNYYFIMDLTQLIDDSFQLSGKVWFINGIKQHSRSGIQRLFHHQKKDGSLGSFVRTRFGDNWGEIIPEYNGICETECVKGIIEDVNELKMLNSHDYYVAGWVDGNLDPNAVEYRGDKEFANDWNFYLLDTTDNAGETTTPVGKLMRGNLLKFENGDYSPTVGITEEMRSQCDTDLYLDEGVVSLAYGAGAYDAKAEWDIDKALIQSGSSPRALYDRHGKAVSHKLRPWETTETKYTIGVGRDYTVYVLDNIKGESGKIWAGLFKKPIVWDGIDVSMYPLRPTAYTPCPVVTIDNKSRCFFYAYEAGDANCRSHSGVNNTCQMFVNGRTYPRTVDMNQINDMTWSRANNANIDNPYPFAEGGFHALNAYIISQEIYYGRKDLHNVNMFGSGISSNDPCNSEGTWKSNGGVRYKLSSSSTWKYLRWNESADIKEVDSYNYLFMSHVVNMEYQKEQCMESQMAASYANEIGANEGVDFDFYGAYYSYMNVPQTNGLNGMNVKIMKVMRDTFNAKDSSNQSVSWDLEAMLRMSLFGGVSLSGDILMYSGGGYEQVGELVNNPNTNRAGNPFKLYMECDQTKWMKVTDVNKADRGVFDFESVYPFMGDFDNKSNGYVKKRAPYTGWKVENGGSIITGECCYGWSDCYWGSTIGTRTRVAARFRGNAHNSACSARYLHANNAVSYAARFDAGSAQALLKVGAATPQA